MQLINIIPFIHEVFLLLFEKLFHIVNQWINQTCGAIKDIKITSNIVIKMDKVMKFPYYVDGKQMVLFSGKDAFMLKLRGNDFNKWLKSLK